MSENLSPFDEDILKKLEDLAIKLYNKLDYDCARDICSIIQDIYIEETMVEEAKRFESIIKKLDIIENYMETNREIFMKSAIESEKAIDEDKNK